MTGAQRPSVEAVVWDLGGVLVAWDPRPLFRPMLGSDAELEAFLRDDFADWNHRQDAGRSMVDGLADVATRLPHRRALFEAFASRFPETLHGSIGGSVELLDELRRRDQVRLLALTNWSSDTFPHASATFDFLTWFEAVVVSGDEQLAKPDERLFRLLLERHGLDPATTVYIDDAPHNVAAAERLGLVALQFTDPATLRRDLAALGLLPPERAAAPPG